MTADTVDVDMDACVVVVVVVVSGSCVVVVVDVVVVVVVVVSGAGVAPSHEPIVSEIVSSAMSLKGEKPWPPTVPRMNTRPVSALRVTSPRNQTFPCSPSVDGKSSH